MKVIRHETKTVQDEIVPKTYFIQYFDESETVPIRKKYFLLSITPTIDMVGRPGKAKTERTGHAILSWKEMYRHKEDAGSVKYSQVDGVRSVRKEQI